MRFVVHRLIISILAVGLLVLGVPISVAAEESGTGDSTAPESATPEFLESQTEVPPTTVPPTSAPPTSDSGTTGSPTIVPSPDPSNEDDDSDATTTTVDGQSADGETTTTVEDPLALDDPLAEEPVPETVPQTDITVPGSIDSKGRYAGQEEFKPTEVLFSSVREAQIKVDDANLDLEETVARAKALRLRIKELSVEIGGLDQETQATLELLAQVRDRIRERALTAFVRGSEAELGVGLDYDALLDLQVKSTILGSILNVDRESLLSYEDLRDMLDSSIVEVHDRKVLVESLLADFEEQVVRDRLAIEQAERELETFAAGSPIYIEGVVFPVGDLAYEMPLIDSYGFPRMVGSEDEHWHEGIDIFAPLGAPLVAGERGVITRVNSSELGGLTLWLRGESGTDWYYAHLSGFAQDLHTGQLVEAGDLLGFVGTSGNAVGTPPHLHMQIHPNGDDAINPYPLLFVASEREIVAHEEELARLAAEELAKLESQAQQELEWIRRYES